MPKQIHTAFAFWRFVCCVLAKHRFLLYSQMCACVFVYFGCAKITTVKFLENYSVVSLAFWRHNKARTHTHTLSGVLMPRTVSSASKCVCSDSLSTQRCECVEIGDIHLFRLFNVYSVQTYRAHIFGHNVKTLVRVTAVFPFEFDSTNSKRYNHDIRRYIEICSFL